MYCTEEPFCAVNMTQASQVVRHIILQNQRQLILLFTEAREELARLDEHDVVPG
jgi:hypothetical protein